MDNQRNELETQAEALTTSVNDVIRFTLKLRNFISNIFQDFVSTYHTQPKTPQRLVASCQLYRLVATCHFQTCYNKPVKIINLQQVC